MKNTTFIIFGITAVLAASGAEAKEALRPVVYFHALKQTAVTGIIHDGGIADDPTETAMPATWNDCSSENFAFISERDGVENVYASIGGEVTPVTHNISNLRRYDRLSSRPDQPLLAFDELTIAGIIGIIRTEFTMGLGEDTYLADAGVPTTAFVWSPDGSKSAYLQQRYTSAGRSSEIHVIDKATAADHMIHLHDGPGVEFGRLALWGDYVIFAMTDSLGTTLYSYNFQHPAAYPTSIPVQNAGGWTLWIDAKDPAVSPDGLTLAFSEKSFGPRRLISTCRLAEGSQYLNCFDKRVLVATSAVNTSPAWSPDGRSLYFASGYYYASYSKIHRVLSDGTGEEAVTNGVGNDFSPVAVAHPDFCTNH